MSLTVYIICYAWEDTTISKRYFVHKVELIGPLVTHTHTSDINDLSTTAFINNLNHSITVNPERVIAHTNSLNVLEVRTTNQPLDYDPLTEPPDIQLKTVVVGGAITSHGLDPNASEVDIQKTYPIFNVFLPSFCQTYSGGFSYHIYLAYDVDDPMFSVQQRRERFERVFWNIVKSMCHQKSSISLHWVHCNHRHKPAYAQNDAIMQAYLDGMQYFYRVNDDTKFITAGWTEAFISTLKHFDPPNVGVVGPSYSEGNTDDMTYDFTHHSHQTLFGYHYPRDFPGKTDVH